MVVGGLDAVGADEGPQRRPALEQALGEQPVVLRPRALPGRVLEQRSELVLERGDLRLQPGPVAVLLVALPAGKELAVSSTAGGRV